MSERLSRKTPPCHVNITNSIAVFDYRLHLIDEIDPGQDTSKSVCPHRVIRIEIFNTFLSCQLGNDPFNYFQAMIRVSCL